LDEEKRKYQKKIEELRFEQNQLAKNTPLPLKKLKGIKNEIKKLEPLLKEREQELQKHLFLIPNIPLKDVPVGKDERDNVIVRKWGKLPKFDFQFKDYLTIAEKLDLIDVKRAAKISGSRFGFLKRQAVLLEFALIKLAFDTLTKKGFIPLLPPVMLKKEIARGMGYFEQADEKEAYFLPEDNLYLAGTAEQPIGAMHKDEVFKEKDLPKRYVGFSTCFRREAGSYGKDTVGIFRVHQFDKVEMFSFCQPEKSEEEHQFFLKLEEEFMQKLKLPYQVIHLCTGDMGLPSASTFDVETWIPSQSRFRETHSTSNCTDFQARRLNIKYKPLKPKTYNLKPRYIHTINGTAFAIQRMLIAIIENYQQKDGSIRIPEVLQRYLGKKVIK
jgi:seryl-tRNA synthetase